MGAGRLMQGFGHAKHALLPTELYRLCPLLLPMLISNSGFLLASLQSRDHSQAVMASLFRKHGGWKRGRLKRTSNQRLRASLVLPFGAVPTTKAHILLYKQGRRNRLHTSSCFTLSDFLNGTVTSDTLHLILILPALSSQGRKHFGNRAS